MRLRLYAVIKFIFGKKQNISINFTCNRCDPMVTELLEFCSYCKDLLYCITHCVTIAQTFNSAAKEKTRLTPALVHFTVLWRELKRASDVSCSPSGRSCVGNSAAPGAPCVAQSRRRALCAHGAGKGKTHHRRCCVSPQL